MVNFNVFTCRHKVEYFRQAFNSSAGVDRGITGNVCLKSPASNIDAFPNGLMFPRKSCNDRLRASSDFLIAKANMEQPTGCLLRCHRFVFVWFLIYRHLLLIFLLYKGYPSFPVTVLDTNARGYRLVHFPSIMHGDFGFSVPQRPCIIFFVTTSCKSLSTSASDRPKHFMFTMKSISDFSVCLKTRAVMSYLSTRDSAGSKSCCISSQAGLHVNVMNRSGRP